MRNPPPLRWHLRNVSVTRWSRLNSATAFNRPRPSTASYPTSNLDGRSRKLLGGGEARDGHQSRGRMSGPESSDLASGEFSQRHGRARLHGPRQPGRASWPGQADANDTGKDAEGNENRSRRCGVGRFFRARRFRDGRPGPVAGRSHTGPFSPLHVAGRPVAGRWPIWSTKFGPELDRRLDQPHRHGPPTTPSSGRAHRHTGERLGINFPLMSQQATGRDSDRVFAGIMTASGRRTPHGAIPIRRLGLSTCGCSQTASRAHAFGKARSPARR